MELTYTPSENSGPKEGQMLKEHPDWVKKFPLRLLGAHEVRVTSSPLGTFREN